MRAGMKEPQSASYRNSYLEFSRDIEKALIILERMLRMAKIRKKFAESKNDYYEAMGMAGAVKARCAGTVRQGQPEAMDIVACVLHELQNPITAILCAGENIRDGLLEDKESLREEGTIIITQAMRLMSLGDQMMLYAKTGRAAPRRDMRALTAAQLVDHAVNSDFILLQRGEFTLERQIQPGLPVVWGDLSLLSQCLHNLIANAVKYGGQRRWVRVSAQVGWSSSAEQEELHICVSDRGIGISEEDLAHVFEPFYRSRRPAVSKIPGTGLGLSIAKSCAEACGGTLSVVSVEGAGCVFTLHLPLLKECAMELTTQEIGEGNE